MTLWEGLSVLRKICAKRKDRKAVETVLVMLSGLSISIDTAESLQPIKASRLKCTTNENEC